MGTLNIRTDDAMETALRELAGDTRSRSEAVRYAVLRTYRETLIEQAEADAERLESDPDDQAEMLAIQRFMGVTERSFVERSTTSRRSRGLKVTSNRGGDTQ